MSDISNYVNDESVDVAIFSLSLWGTNYKDYIKESYRVLKPKGIIYIAEPSKYYETPEDIIGLTKLITEIGFQQIGNIENRGKFIYITGIKI
jgi:ribosomal RNA-processing protein 8